jgi:dCMP deaminase
MARGRLADVMRPTLDETMLRVAIDMANRGTCCRRKVGCVLTNQRGHILSTGYNGPPTGDDHCIEVPCPGAKMPSGTGLELCEAIHAEINALLQCKNVYEIYTCYTISSPCRDCVKVLRNTSCKRIIFLEEYPHPEAKDRWLRMPGNVWSKHPDFRAVL